MTKLIEIQKHEDITSQIWYGTKLDSQAHFKDTWYPLDKELLNKYFQVGNNGGSYGINFNSKDLDKIIHDLTPLGYKFVYVKPIGYTGKEEISKEEYLKQEVLPDIDERTISLIEAGV